jgi:hypothetical protein
MTSTSKLPIEALQTIFDVLKTNGYFSDPSKLNSLAYMARNINNSPDGFQLFKKYSGADESVFYGKPGAKNYSDVYNVNAFLLSIRKLDNQVFKDHLQKYMTEKYAHLVKKFNQKYIWDDKDLSMFNSFVKSDTKVLTIKSSYGSGKTFAFKNLIDRYFEDARILFITYRKSLATAFTKDLKKRFGFKCYLECKPEQYRNASRLIIQLDSIKNLVEYDTFIQETTMPEYDLVLLDEIEGTLGHLSYNKIDQEYIYHLLKKILDSTPKVLALDGDMSERSYDFFTSLQYKSTFLENERKATPKHFVVQHNCHHWFEAIDAALEENQSKNKGLRAKDVGEDVFHRQGVIVVCMSMSMSEDVYERYKDKYKVVIHNSLEKNADVLEDVEKHWSDVDMVIYSPTVEAGVDYSVPGKFTKCFASVSNTSTTVRAFHQMLNRCRNFESNEILVYMPETIKLLDFPFLETFHSLKSFKYANMPIDTLTTILIHNEVERMNSTKSFATTFEKSIQDKGHTIEYLSHVKKATEKAKTQTEKQIQKIVEAHPLSDGQFNEILVAQRSNRSVSREEQYAVKNYIYKKAFCEDILTEENMKVYYDKFHVVKNYFRLLKPARVYEKLRRLPFLKYEACESVKELLSHFNTRVENGNFNFSQNVEITEDIIGKVTDLMNSKLFQQRMSPLNCFIDTKNSKTFFNRVESVLETYGISFEKARKQYRVDGKVKSTNVVTLGTGSLIRGYLERKSSAKCLIQNEVTEESEPTILVKTGSELTSADKLLFLRTYVEMKYPDMEFNDFAEMETNLEVIDMAYEELMLTFVNGQN